MSEIKLKNCPFCGKELIINKGYYAHELSLTEPIECYAATWVFRVDDEKSIELWNTRKPMDNIIEQLEMVLDVAEDEAIKDHNKFGDYYATIRAIEIVKECAE